MRIIPRLMRAAMTLSLVACGGSEPGGTDPVPAHYTVRITVTGLSGTAVLRNNGGDV